MEGALLEVALITLPTSEVAPCELTAREELLVFGVKAADESRKGDSGQHSCGSRQMSCGIQCIMRTLCHRIVIVGVDSEVLRHRGKRSRIEHCGCDSMSEQMSDWPT